MKINDKYKELFNFFIQEHDLILTNTEIEEILHEVKKIIKEECDHKWIRTTKNYKKAKKCYKCKEVVIIEKNNLKL